MRTTIFRHWRGGGGQGGGGRGGDIGTRSSNLHSLRGCGNVSHVSMAVIVARGM